MKKGIFIVGVSLLIIGVVYYYVTVTRVDNYMENVVDNSGRSEVFINMTDFSFVPANVIISKGAKVTWINKDSVGHSVKTDPHPEHSIFPDMDSGDLSLGAEHSFIFENEGVYPYHCDPHVRGMKGIITVK